MSRLREFDRTDVVTKALNLFWSDGYNASSISKLIDVMGINRGVSMPRFAIRPAFSPRQ